MRLPKVNSVALMLPPAPLRCTRCERAAAERYGVAFGPGTSDRWENGFHSNDRSLIHDQDAPARIVSFLRSKGLVPSPYLVEILSDYGYRAEPVAGDAGLPG
ncbi:MAG TPA: hypothetical protein VHB47_06270 [Thermoanaerobaculia bacterium]|nr:hypothetical protein [Thermoanaerobaculia bacterium]